MPELPEVEIAARNLRAWALGRRVERAEAEQQAKRIFRPARPKAFVAALTGRRVDEVRRVGKHILVRLDAAGDAGPLGLISHLGMTGKWLRRRGGEAAPSHSRARLHLDDGATLHYRDPRLFGRLRLVPGAVNETIAREEGPEIAYVEESGTENPFLVYAREGERCPRCRREAIRRIVQGQRSTFFCPRCQR